MTGPGGTQPPPLLASLVRSGTAAAARGDLAAAARDFEAAVVVARRARRPVDEARCLVFVAQARRLVGERAAAVAAITRARRLVRPGDPVRAIVLEEHAEILVSGNELTAAAAVLEEAIAAAGPANGPAAGQATGQDAEPAADHAARARRTRRLATILVALGDGGRADAAFRAAIEDWAAAGQPKAAAETAVERATATWNLRLPGFNGALADARVRAAEPANPVALGQLDILDATAAVDDGRLDDADALVRQARDRALAAVDPVLYSGASIALSGIADRRGDRVGAYDALATGWATLGDLLGRDAAAAVFRPRMEELETAWGTEAFVAVRTAWTSARRTARTG